MKNVKVTDNALSGINIVPVIGVTLVLLVIQLVMSPIMNIPNVHVELPEAMTKETKEENLTVSLSKDGVISVGNTIVEWGQIGRTLKKELKGRDDAAVIVRADKSLRYGSVEKLIRHVNKFVGNRAVAVATKQRRVPITQAIK